MCASACVCRCSHTTGKEQFEATCYNTGDCRGEEGKREIYGDKNIINYFLTNTKHNNSGASTFLIWVSYLKK